MNQVELLMRRRNVAAFIAAQPALITITRNTGPTKTAAGGLVPSAPETLDPQTVRIVQTKRRYSDGVEHTEAGDVIKNSDYYLIAPHNADIAEEDEFLFRGDHYRVTGIDDLRIESILAAITLRGKDNSSAGE